MSDEAIVQRRIWDLAVRTLSDKPQTIVTPFQPSLLPVRLTTPGQHLQLTLGHLTPPRTASRPFDTTDDPAERDYQQGRTGCASSRSATAAAVRCSTASGGAAKRPCRRVRSASR